MSVPLTGAGRALRRLRGLVLKEGLQIVRDPSSFAIAFVLPAVLLFLFGYGVSLDARQIPIALVVQNPSEATASLTASFVSTPYFAPRILRSRRHAEDALVRGEVRGVLVLDQSFAEKLLQPGSAPIQLLVDGTDANTGRQVIGYTRRVWQQWLELYARNHGRVAHQLIEQQPRVWFNPEVRSQDFLVPGLIAIIMTLTGALLTSLLVAREYDRGTIEALFVTPASVGEILAGKLLPTFVLGMGGMVMSVAMAVWIFEVPLRGSFWVLALAAALFLLAALGMGLLISTLAKNQFVAGQIAIMVTFLPAFLLSNFIFNLSSTPAWVQAISHLIAARYFIAILKTLFLAGDVWSVILPNAAALLGMAVFFLGLSRLLTRKHLD